MMPSTATPDQIRARRGNAGHSRAACRVAGAALLALLVSGCPAPDDPGPSGPFHEPSSVVASSALEGPRGWRLQRGIVHSHSPYSHDACDGDPRPDGARNEACFEAVRDGMCQTRQDYVFLTDHDDLFAEHPFPDVLLYKEGDQLVERSDRPVANRVDCGDGHSVLVAAGTESGVMPIGLEHHVGDTVQARNQAYNDISPTGVQALQAAGGLVFLQHTEDWSLSDIIDLNVDGIEMYNLHQNMMDNMGTVAEMVLTYVVDPEVVPIPELGLIAAFQESAADLSLWAQASAQRRLPAVLATDVHQNVFNDETYDGDRLDSFRRMMHWFSNYALVPAGETVDDLTLKVAIAEGRLFGAFDYLGYPVGFDFYAESGGAQVEMGGEISGASSATLFVSAAAIHRLNPNGPQPELRSRILKAVGQTWEEVESGAGDLEVQVGPGVYRAEIRMVPHHLTEWLGLGAELYLRDLVWIYSNPIYVR